MSKKLIYPISLVMVLALAGFVQAELLVNGGFEAGIESWGVWGSGSGSGSGGYIGWNSNVHAAIMEDGTAHGGNKYVETGFPLGNAEWWGWGYSSFYQENIPITAGNAYQISAWVRDGDANGATSLIANGTRIVWEWYVAEGVRLDADGDGNWQNDAVYYQFDLTGEWTQISATEVAPPGVIGLTVALGTDTFNINVDIDDASVIEGAGYLWNGSAADGLWDTPANWTVTNSTWTWPNEEAAAANAVDPNAATKWTNADTLAINILNGDAVTHSGWLAIQGALDGSTTAVLTLNNGSSLTLNGRLATSTTSGMMGRGQINILGGSTVTITDGKDLRIADDNGNWGTLNIVDSTVDIADDLVTDSGEGHINISGSSIVNADDIVIADPENGLGYLNISGTSVVTVVDDLRIDEGVGYITISGDAIVSVGDEIYVGDNVTGLGYLDISGNAIIIDVDDLRIDDGEGHITISGNASFSCDDIQVANKTTSVGTLDISGNAWVYVNDDFSAGEDGIGTVNISGDAILIVRDLLYVAHDAGEGTLNISDNATVYALDDLNVGNAGGVTATLNISGNPTINVKDEFLMCDDDDGAPTNSTVIMDGGRVTVGDHLYINDDNTGTATFIMNGGSFFADDDILVAEFLEGTGHLTVNGGSMISGDNLKMGDSGGANIGQSRIFMNGGLLQAEGLDFNMLDSQIVYSGGEFRIASDDVNEADMQQLITDGKIVTTGAYSIDTDGNYTVLSSLSPAAAKFPSPADGAEDVLIGTTLSWVPGDTAATHDVYFGTTNTPPSIGNQEAASYYPGLLQPDTTYYWQIDEVEADGTTKHAGNINSFTTGISNVAMQIRIKASSDDTESDINGSNSLDSGDLEIPYDGDPAPDKLQVIGLRFADVGLAKGTTITSAAVQFDEDDVDNPRHTNNVHIIIEGQLNPNPDTFADVNDPVADREPKTTAKVEWDPPVWGAEHVRGPEARTSDVSSIIQELIDQDGWTTGNSIVLILSDNPDNPSVGMREAESFDGAGGNASRRPTLHVTAISDTATGPNPANGATDVPIDTILSWWPGVGAVSHDGYAGTSSPPPFIGNTPEVSFDPGVLEPSTTYYWQIDAVDADGTKHTGQIWSFATSPGEATEPDPADGALLGTLDMTLTWRPGATAVSRDVYFGTTSPPPLIGNQTEPNFTTGALQAETVYYWQVDEIDADAKKYTGEIWSFKTPRPGTGSIARQVWLNIGGGNEIAILRDHPDFPLNPTYSDELPSFATPSGIADEYGSRLQGYLHPETSGDYLFWIASDDNGELWLSTDESPANAVKISTVSASTGYLDFDDGDITPSGPISLEAGKKYYIEAIYKEGTGGDHCAVAWQGPDSPERAVIVGYFLSPFMQLKAFNPDPADGATEVPKTLTLSWAPGATAVSHNVYFSIDQQAVIDGTALVSVQTETSYSPAGLVRDITYYWRVDELEADSTTNTGDVWSFTYAYAGR